MKTSRIPATVFGLLLIGYMVFLAWTVPMPGQVVTNFDASGHLNGWMSRFSPTIFQGFVGLILPLVMAVGFFTVRFVPPERIDVPGRDFWFAPERRNHTCAYLSRQGFWLASWFVSLQGVMAWHQLIEANASIPQLSSSGFLVVFSVFGMAILAWAMSFFRHFAKAA